MRPTTDVSSANLMMWLELNLAVQSWVSSVKSSGLSTQPCGAPVLSVVVLEVLWPTRTDWGLPVKKSRIQLQRELLRPSRLNLLMSCCGIIVLNAELKSMNSILTYESLFSRWVRARWRVEEIASSVGAIWAVCKLERIECVGDAGFDVVHD